MLLYILHYATINEEGRLSIDCQGPFKTKEEAQQQQSSPITNFRSAHRNLSTNEIEEHCATFHRIAYAGQLTKMQSHIEEIEA